MFVLLILLSPAASFAHPGQEKECRDDFLAEIIPLQNINRFCESTASTAQQVRDCAAKYKVLADPVRRRYKICLGQKVTVKIDIECGDDYSVTIWCPSNMYILDCAEEQGVDLPYSSRAGADSSSVGVLQMGEVDQSDQSFLDDAQIAAGFFLYDVAYPNSDVAFRACDTEEMLF